MSQVISIPAAGAPVEVMAGSFLYFYFRTAASPFEVSYDRGASWSVRYQNDQDRVTARQRDFSRGHVLFRAYLGVAVDVTADWGDTQFTSQQATVTGNVTSAMANNIGDNVAAIPLQITKTANAGVVTALANAPLYFRWAYLIAQKDLTGTANAGDVRVGFANGAQPILLSPGDQYELPIPPGVKVDFQNVFIKTANNGDGVSVIYV